MVTMNVPRLVATMLVLCFSCALIEGGTSCSVPIPLYGTNKCGPDNALGYLGADKAAFPYARTWNGIPTGGGSNERSFKEACKDHDDCYEDVKNGSFNSESACLNAMMACNSKFYNDMEDKCKTLPKSCQRSRCRNDYRDVYHGLVLGFVPVYFEDYCT